MLRQRVITALIAAPTVLAAIFLLPPLPFAFVFLALVALGVFEWARLAGLSTPTAQGAYLAGYAVAAYCVLLAPALWSTILAVTVCFWLLAGVIVVTFPASRSVLKTPLLVPAGYVVFVGAWLALVALGDHAAGRWLIVWVFGVVWGADIGAYFAGRRFGRRKLAVHVSPGKTWEGALGGIAAATAIGVVAGRFVPALAALEWDLARWASGALVLAIVSVFGDLFESAVKRARSVKDSGSLFPGHGGMLDRVDSLVAALPCVALALSQQG